MILNGDSLSVLGGIKSETIDMCLTSPPYWGLRDYGHPDQLGLESTPELYIEKMTAIFHEVKRVLKKEGTLWLNMGDTYGGGSGGYHPHAGELGASKSYIQRPSINMGKCLCMIPERLAWSLIQDGWILRNKIIWYKHNSMPSSVTDRFSNKYEFIYLFSQQQKYYFDLNAVMVDAKTEFLYKDPKKYNGKYSDESNVSSPRANKRYKLNPRQKVNPGDVFEINTQPFPEAHFAVFPEKLCDKPIKAGCPDGGIVLDPFCGSGTVGVVSKEQGKKFIGIDVNFEYCQMAMKRIAKSGYQMSL